MRVIPSGAPHARRGTTLIELIVALLLSAILGAVALRLLDRVHRFVRGTTLVTETHAQLDAVVATVRGAIEGVAAAGGDLRVATDSSMAWAGGVGHAVTCARSALAIDVPPAALASGVALTWWSQSPQPGDLLVAFDDGARAGAADDRWFLTQVIAVTTVPNGCSATPYVDPVADAGKSGWRLAVADTIPATVRPGAAIRLLRPQRLALYRSSSQWMLGWADTNVAAGGWNVIQPLAGPLEPYAAAPGGGLSLGWLDSAATPLGSAVASPTQVRAARASLRARTSTAIRMDGRARGIRVDSLVVRLPLRNRR